MNSILICYFIGFITSYHLKSLGYFQVTGPAFLNFVDYDLPNHPKDLIISCFNGNPLSDDYLYLVPNFASHLHNLKEISPIKISSSITWPNEAISANYSHFNEKILVVAGGFLVPGKFTGAINLIRMGKSGYPAHQISENKFEYFYHMVEWKDMNGDGLKDIVTARAFKSIFGSSGGELIWYERPKKGALSQRWKEHHLIDGPDIFFRFADLNNDGHDELIATQFFSSKIVLYWTNNGMWNDTSSIQSRVIDDSIGPPFSSELKDINYDGKLDLLVTNHDGSTDISGVFVYEIPNDIFQGKWKRHTIASGFVTRESGVGQASPGGARAFYPNVRQTNQKPLILLSGDGSQQAYILTPKSSSPSNWGYNVTVIVDSDSTIGQVMNADLNGDGWTEILVPEYNSNKIYGFSYEPK